MRRQVDGWDDESIHIFLDYYAHYALLKKPAPDGEADQELEELRFEEWTVHAIQDGQVSSDRSYKQENTHSRTFLTHSL